MNTRFLIAGLMLVAGVLFSQSKPIPNLVTIESNVPVAAPAWAVMERRLLDVMSEAAVRFARKNTRSGGTLTWRTSGGASLDDLPESFYNFPLLYALGGDERLKALSFQEWNATLRQLTYDFPVMHKEFPKHGDWFHIGEGWLYFYFLSLVDPTDHETVDRAKRYAGFYLNEDPGAPNYDAALKLIRSPHSGSTGPVFGKEEGAAPYRWSKGMRSYGLPLTDIPGIGHYDHLKDTAKAQQMGAAMQKRIYRGDVATNLLSTALVANAYLLTGDEKYANWIREYTGAWLERARANGGIAPDNVGLSGKIGEYHGGKWWGGLYGWQWPHGYYNVSMGLQVAAASAALVSKGDPRYLELPRTTLDQIMAKGKSHKGAFLVPTKHNHSGWFAWRPLWRWVPASLWFVSQDPADWQRVEKLRGASQVDWHKATGGAYPNEGYAKEPDEMQDCFNCDSEGLTDWNFIADLRSKEDNGHEGPWLRFLSGAFPDYPERMLSTAFGTVAFKQRQVRDNVLLLEYDPRGTTRLNPEDIDITKVHEHHWQSTNPVTTEALVQLMLGAPQIIYNGGLLHASLRYFDPLNQRPGLPKDVGALVRKISADRVVVELVNLSPFDSRDVIVQAGTFGEHEFTTVKFQRRTDPDPIQPDFFNRPAPTLADQSATVNRKFFQVRLPAGMGLTIEAGMRRFANQPSYAFPWHGDRIPVR